MTDQEIRFIDLFAGVGGFHAVGHALDAKCVLAVEIDSNAAAVYELNWGVTPKSDVRQIALEPEKTPSHDVVFAGFPCQPFSKSGKQQGESEDRGNLFYAIVEIVREKRPALIMLENVRNLAGPKHKETLARIIELLRVNGYVLDETPVVVSPHEIHPAHGGRPQVRERVFILAVRGDLLTNSEGFTFARSDVLNELSPWDPSNWNFRRHVSMAVPHPIEPNLSDDEIQAIEMWEDFLQTLRSVGQTRLSGFPIWSDFFTEKPLAEEESFPEWKRSFVSKNRKLYLNNRAKIDQWKDTWATQLNTLNASKRKFEWQAQDLESIWEGAIQFRPSGVRVKKATYLPALVAISQTSILASESRRISVSEAADLQGFPIAFEFGGQSDAASYKQMGNAVNVGVVYQVLRSFAAKVSPLLNNSPESKKIKSIAAAPIEFEPRNVLGAESESRG